MCKKNKYLLVLLICMCLMGACKVKKNSKYNPKKCRTCPTFSYDIDIAQPKYIVSDEV